MTITCTLDFETRSAADLKRVGAWRYSEDPTTEIVCLRYEREGEADIRGWWPGGRDPVLLEQAHNPEVIFIAHNAAFEKAIWRNIMVPVYGFPDVPDDRWHDTLAVCAMKALPQELDKAVLVLRLPQEKDKEGSRAARALSKPNLAGYYDYSPEKLERVYAYCGQDIRAEAGLHRRLGWLPSGERDVWLLDQRINQRGVRLDLEFVAACRQVVDRASVPLAAEFREITNGLAFTQRDKVIAWVREQGVVIPDMKKETLADMLGISEDEDGEDDWQNATPPAATLPPEVRRALSIRQLIGSASIKKLRRMEECVGSDGRARGLLQYHGAGPGRWAGRLLQPQNFPRGTTRLDDKAPPPEMVVEAIMTRDPEWVAMTIGPPVETVVSALRHAIIAEPQHELCAGDFAQIEARVVLALAGQHDKIELLKAGLDPYNDLATQVYGRPINRKIDVEEGHVGKGGFLGCGFQMGWKKFQARVLLQTGIFISEELAKKVISTYREDWAPAVPKVWHGLENAALRTVWDRTPHEAYGVAYALEDGWLTALLPSGRKLWYHNPQKTRKAMPWDDTDVRPAWTYQAMKVGQWKTIDAFGGLLTENVVQGLARDIMVSAMFKAEANGFPVILTVHDEIISEPLTRETNPATLAEIMADVPGWVKALQIPVKAETWSGARYKK